MRVIKATNPHLALPEAIALLDKHGIRRPSRYGDVFVMEEPVTTVYSKPEQRVIFWAVRDANPFLHFFTGLHVLAGRNDVGFLSLFAKRMASFSDDGVTLHGAYGHRWRHHFGLDQIGRVINLLNNHPNSRRAVLTMFDPRVDLHDHELHKDLPCLSGSTRLASPEGNRSLAELASEFSQGRITRWPVYAFDPITKAMRLTWCSNVWRSDKKVVYRITFDDGSSVEATGDHRFYAKRFRDSQYCLEIKVNELRRGDRVWATHFWHTPKGHLVFKRRLDCNTAFSNQQKVHNAYFELMTGITPAEPYPVVHHLNENKEDNRWENLRGLTKSEHDAHHRRGASNPIHNLSAAQQKQRAERWKKSITKTRNGFTTSEREARYNHVIVDIEELAQQRDVYDFTVPEFHNAMLDNGVFTHNCNTQIYLWLHENALNMSVTCRSNDIIWGCYGENCVVFSMVHEVLAAKLGAKVGQCWQISNNFHAYLNTFEPVRKLGDEAFDVYRRPVDPYAFMKTYPMVQDPESWFSDLTEFMAYPEKPVPGGNTDFFSNVATPLWLAHKAWRDKDNAHRFKRAHEALTACKAEDWRQAAEDWVRRRHVSAAGKQP